MKGEKVASDKNLFRRGYGPPNKHYLNPDGSATSRVFRLREKDEGSLSVDVKEMTTPKKSIGDESKFVLFEVAVSIVEQISLVTLHDPLTLEEHGRDNPAHALILGLEIEDDIKPGLLARASRRVYFDS